MVEEILQMYLPAFMIIAMILLFFWKQFRRATQIQVYSSSAEIITEYSRMKRTNTYYWIVFLLFIFMTIVYSIAPEFYFIFLPLDMFNHPLINELGLMVLKISLIWIVIAQINIDKELYKYSRDIESLSAMELIRYSEKMLLTGMLVLFVGIFTTITNIVGMILVLFSLLIYFRIFKYGYLH